MMPNHIWKCLFLAMTTVFMTVLVQGAPTSEIELDSYTYTGGVFSGRLYVCGIYLYIIKRKIQENTVLLMLVIPNIYRLKILRTPRK